jgi:hypothetical protein
VSLNVGDRDAASYTCLSRSHRTLHQEALITAQGRRSCYRCTHFDYEHLLISSRRSVIRHSEHPAGGLPAEPTSSAQSGESPGKQPSSEHHYL